MLRVPSRGYCRSLEGTHNSYLLGSQCGYAGRLLGKNTKATCTTLCQTICKDSLVERSIVILNESTLTTETSTSVVLA